MNDVIEPDLSMVLAILLKGELAISPIAQLMHCILPRPPKSFVQSSPPCI
jgi:hypothetical protein